MPALTIKVHSAHAGNSRCDCGHGAAEATEAVSGVYLQSCQQLRTVSVMGPNHTQRKPLAMTYPEM